VLLSGEAAGEAEAVASAIAAAKRDVPTLVVSAQGVLTERGEVESDSAAAVLAWAGPTATPYIVDRPRADESVAWLTREVLADRAADLSALFTFVAPEGVAPSSLEPLEDLPKELPLIGGGTRPGPHRLYSVERGGAVRSGTAAALGVRGLSKPSIRCALGCRLLGPLGRITKASGSMVLEIDGQNALDVLSVATSHLSGQPLVLVALASQNDEETRPDLVTRAVQGVDPLRGGLVVGDDARTGEWIAFAVRDASRSRAELDAAIRHLAREIAGAAPRFGLYISCVGRGTGLYGTPDVDVRAIKARFPEMPLGGMHASFEIVRVDGRPTLQLYSGVLGVFSSPS
jgi:small ligand-binding sensory domain FIST